MKSSIAIATLLVAGLGLAAVGPVIAQSAPASPGAPPLAAPDAMSGLGLPGPNGDPQMFDARAMMPGRDMGRGALMMLACSPRGGEALDVALLRLSYKLDLTADQKSLFDTFHDKALATQTNFADTCKVDRRATTADAKPDFLARLKARLALDQARVTALNDVLPSFEALYDTLTDTQKAALMPQRDAGMVGGPHGFTKPWKIHPGSPDSPPSTT